MNEARKTVGLVGTGRMGTAIGERLLETGFRLVVHNRTRGRAEALLTAGARWAANPAEVAAHTPVVLTALFDEAAVREVYLGEAGLLTSGTPGLLVEMSTIRAAVCRELAAIARHHRIGLVDAALAGPPAAARAGQLLILAGGNTEDLHTAAPVLDAISRRVEHLGEVGAGVTMKLVLMHTMGVYFAGLAEALASGRALGLEPERMLQVILDSHGAPPVLQDRASALLAEVDGRPTPVGFPVAGVRKDLTAIIATVNEAGAGAAMATSALATFGAAADAGFSERDLISVVASSIEATDRRRGRPTGS